MRKLIFNLHWIKNNCSNNCQICNKRSNQSGVENNSRDVCEEDEKEILGEKSAREKGGRRDGRQ